MNIILAIANFVFGGMTLLAALATDKEDPTYRNKFGWLFIFFLFFCNAVYMVVTP